MIDNEQRSTLVGRRFHEYVIEERLAAGGMGEVYLLRHATLSHTRKVLKVILPEYASNAFIRTRFEQEADAVSQLGEHPNIVGIDNFGSMDDGQLWMMIPFISGKPLDKYLQDHGGKLAPHRVMHFLCHIGLGIDHAHQCGIVHRDLKPSNVFVTTAGNGSEACKVLDFGVARRMNPSAHLPSTTQHGPLGTPSYMAVEQYEYAADASFPADVYALACMTWEMVTGALPWGSVEDSAVLYRRKLQEPPDPPIGNALPPAWESILRTALSVAPGERPQSVRELVKALAVALPGIPPMVPSGMQMLSRIAPKLETGPDDETLRKPSTLSGASNWAGHVQLGAMSSRSQSHEDSAGMTGQSGAPVSAGPIAVAAPPLSTTIGASNGVVMASPARASRWKLAILGVATVAGAFLGMYALAASRGGAVIPAVAPPVPTLSRPNMGSSSQPTRPASAQESTSATAAMSGPERTPPTPPRRPAALPPSVPLAGPTAAPAAPPALASAPKPPPPAIVSPATTSPHPAKAKPPVHPRPVEATQAGPTAQHTKPLPAHKFDPNAVGGQDEE